MQLHAAVNPENIPALPAGPPAFAILVIPEF